MLQLEKLLQSYLVQHIELIHPGLEVLETEHSFGPGRVDILAKRKNSLVAIELKARPYNTNHVSTQLLHYLQYFPQVYFVAPKVREGIPSALQEYETRLSFFEVSEGLAISKVRSKDLDDSRSFPDLRKSLCTASQGVVSSLLKSGISTYVADTKLQRVLLQMVSDYSENI